MSTIKVENIRIASEAVSRPVTGVAAAWVNFNGTGTVAIRDSLNIGSITDNGTGAYVENLTSAMSNSGWTLEVSANNLPSAYYLATNGLITTTTAQVFCFNKSMTTASDPTILTSSSHGELA